MIIENEDGSEVIIRGGEVEVRPPVVRVRELTADEVEFTLEIEDEDIPVKGHFASGDDEEDEKLEKSILKRLRNGDTWAWCTVKVTAKWKDFRGVDYLGACSYEDEEDFKKGGYWDDMKSQALDELNDSIKKTVNSVAELIED